ncbi:RsmE family RNA methyltransferase [Fimbriimonas ginsengisoli]|uniref:Ribosomal RNA small subunit methyltransferase E n=1 Tax=Fimbriimonas ginsengisoli Gsoil 348 TaxID=661478 RepID=A0A068NXF5_FIMGI|nr:RsmE family RNA methyltransferase [Fimbriimonas ginsengisoli]AIE88096.1 hypothetical protein OP10G_4728 [Fimbriimonas ginsengisoli Gsoil 348]
MRASLRALPRLFVPDASPEGPIELPKEEIDKLRKVLRLSAGAEIAVLPNDGTLIRCQFQNREAIPLEVIHPNTESPLRLTVAQALPKGDKLDEIVRACTELGVAHFILFPSERTIVRWDEKKKIDRVHRLATIAREAAEVSFRAVLPTFSLADDLAAVLQAKPDSVVLSEVEGLSPKLVPVPGEMTIVVGPEGGWAQRELALIGDRGVTLGPRVLRVDHAAPAAAALLLLDR